MSDKAIIRLLILAGIIIFVGGGLFGFFWSKGGAAPEQASADTVPGRKVSETVPSFVNEALKNAPPDALVGIGTAKMATLSMSMNIANTRARAEIARQMNQVVMQMIREYTVAADADPSTALSFQDRVIVALSTAELSGASIIETDFDEEGNCWSVVMMEKFSVATVILHAQTMAKLEVPQMASFDVEALFPNALTSIIKAGIGVARD